MKALLPQYANAAVFLLVEMGRIALEAPDDAVDERRANSRRMESGGNGRTSWRDYTKLRSHGGDLILDAASADRRSQLIVLNKTPSVGSLGLTSRPVGSPFPLPSAASLLERRLTLVKQAVSLAKAPRRFT